MDRKAGKTVSECREKQIAVSLCHPEVREEAIRGEGWQWAEHTNEGRQGGIKATHCISWRLSGKKRNKSRLCRLIRVGSEGLPHLLWQLLSISLQCDSAAKGVCSVREAQGWKQS